MKKILIVLLAFLLTGCQVNYNLNFKDEELNEKVSILLKDNSYTEQNISILKKNKSYAIYDQIGHEPYNITFQDNSKTFIANYEYTYKLVDFNRSTLINQCYEAAAFVKDGNNYLLTTSNEFRCLTYEYFDVNEVNITITTNHKVISSNADKVKNGKYIWNINKDNITNKPIKIVFGKAKKNIFELFSELNFLIIFLISIAIVGGISYIIISRKNKKNNII